MGDIGAPCSSTDCIDFGRAARTPCTHIYSHIRTAWAALRQAPSAWAHGARTASRQQRASRPDLAEGRARTARRVQRVQKSKQKSRQQRATYSRSILTIEETDRSREPALPAGEITACRADTLGRAQTSQPDIGLSFASSSDRCAAQRHGQPARTRRIPPIRLHHNQSLRTSGTTWHSRRYTPHQRRNSAFPSARHVPASCLRSHLFLLHCIHSEHIAWSAVQTPQSSTRLHQQEERTAASAALSLPQHCSTSAGHT